MEAGLKEKRILQKKAQLFDRLSVSLLSSWRHQSNDFIAKEVLKMLKEVEKVYESEMKKD